MLNSPWELILTEPVPEVVEFRSADWAEKYFSAQSARSSSRETLSPSYTKQQGRLLSAHARESKKLFYFATFVNALRDAAVFGLAEFNNRTFEGESFFNKSSVSHLKHVTAKSNSK